MIMKTEKLEIELRFSTKKIINLTEKLKGKNLSELYFKYANECNERVLSEIVFAFGEKDGKSPFNSDINRVYDFIDDYKKENDKSYSDIYKEIAEVINDEGFFTKKMTKEQLETALSNPMSSINMEEILRTTIDKTAQEIAQEMTFEGYKG